MRTVITHFYNEEYLLPWWLNHHVGMFDHGVLIDYSSSDSSVDICRAIAPHWRVVRSRNVTFEAIAVDFEVMQYESELPGWKIVLNTTEFLCGVNFPVLEALIAQQGLAGCFFEYAVMVDPFPEQVPVHSLPLVEQKCHGFIGDSPLSGHGRLYHKAAIGAYMPGRHRSHQPGLAMANGMGTVMWYSMSPWTGQTLKRKLQIQARIPDGDKKAGLGMQHVTTAERLEEERAALLARTVDLRHLVGR